MHEIEGSDVAGGTRDDDRALERRGGEHGEFGGTLLGRSVGDQVGGDEVGPLREGRGRTIDHRGGGVRFVGVTRLHTHRDDGTSSPEITVQQLLSIVTE